MASSTSRSAESPTPGRPRLWVAAAVAALITILAGLGAVAVWSPLFHARTIDVSGARHLPADTITGLAGISSRTNLLWLDGRAAERRLEQNPWIRQATVSRSLPATVRIAVVERTPLAVARDGEGLVLVAEDGTRLGPAPDRGGLPEVVGEDLGPPIRVIAAMPRWLRREVDRVAVGGDAFVRVVLSTGVRVRYGGVTEVVKKATALAGLLRWAEQGGTQLVSVDVRFPDTPTARVAGTPPGE